MKKLMFAAMVAASMMVMAEEPAQAAPKQDKPVAAQAAKRPPMSKLTPEQRAEMKAKREKFMAERKAKMQANILEVLKKHGIEGEKAQAIVKDLEESIRSPFMMGGRGGLSAKRRPAPAPKADNPAAK